MLRVVFSIRRSVLFRGMYAFIGHHLVTVMPTPNMARRVHSQQLRVVMLYFIIIIMTIS